MFCVIFFSQEGVCEFSELLLQNWRNVHILGNFILMPTLAIDIMVLNESFITPIKYSVQVAQRFFM